jgi:hypothetical protein
MWNLWILSLAYLGQKVSAWNHVGPLQLQDALDSSAYTLIACKLTSEYQSERDVG